MINCKNGLIVFFLCCLCYFSKGQDKPKLVVTTGHHDRVESISYSKNGRYLISADRNIIKIYDLVMQLEFNSIPLFSDKIQQLKISSDNKFIFVQGIRFMFTLAFPSGEIVKQVKVPGYSGAREACFIAPNDKMYLTSQWNEGYTVYDPIKGEVEKKWKDVKLYNVVYLSKKDLVVVRVMDPANKMVYNLHVYNATTGELKKKIPILGGHYGKAFITDRSEELIAIEIDSGRVRIYDTENFNLISQFIAPSGGLSTLEFYPDKKKIIVASYNEKSPLVIIEVMTGKVIKEIKPSVLNDNKGTVVNMASAIYDLEISPDGKTIAVPFQSMYLEFKEIYNAFRIGYYTLSDMSLKHKYDGQGKNFRSLIVNQDESKMITLNISSPFGSRVWDLKKGEVEQFFSGLYELKLANNKLAINYYDKENDKYSIKIYEFSTMKLLAEIKTLGYANLEISPDGKLVGGKVNKFIKGQEMGLAEMTLFVWESESGKELYKKSVGSSDNLVQFSFNKPNQLLIFDYKNSDSVNVECIDPIASKTLKTFKLFNRLKWHNFFEYDNQGDEVYFRTENSKFFEVCSKNINTGIITKHIHEDMRAGLLVMKFNRDCSKAAFFLYDFDSPKLYKVYIYDWKTKSKIAVLDDFLYPISSIAFGDKTGNLYFGDDNGMVSIIGSDYERKASLFTESEKDYLIISADNYYKTSITNTNGLGFSYKDEMYRFDQFDLRYNRPDTVLGKIGIVSPTQVSLYKEAWQKRLKRLGFDEQTVNKAAIHAPNLSIVGKDNLPYTTMAGSIKFAVNLSDSLFDLKSIAVYVNNVPLYGKNGFLIAGKGVHKFTKEIEFELEEGKNKVSVSVFNDKGVESNRQFFVTECTKKFPKPDLYIFALGVSKYKDTTMNLTYSDKDVKDVVNIFVEKNKTSLRYGNVFFKLLTNEEAILKNVNEASSFLKNAKTNDQIILFYSGHGLLDSKLDYYLAMSDIDFNNPSSSGLLYSHFQELFDQLRCRKRLLLIDACHSGEVEKDENAPVVFSGSNPKEQIFEKEFKFRGKKVIGAGNSNELMKELFADLKKETGATVIASSNGTEYSVESSLWKNGAFTYALKEALFAMKADGNKNNEITLSETREYITKKVRELTGGKQNPTTRQENIDFDYRIW